MYHVTPQGETNAYNIALRQFLLLGSGHSYDSILLYSPYMFVSISPFPSVSPQASGSCKEQDSTTLLLFVLS
jgi:hypothetical protein